MTSKLSVIACASAVVAFAGGSATAQAPLFAPAGFVPLHKALCLSAADFTGDGRLDVVVGVEAPVGLQVASLELWRGDGFGAFARVHDVPVPSTATVLRVTDLDADGFPEVLAGMRHANAPAWIAFESQPDGTLAMQQSGPVGGDVSGLACVDVDADGDVDVVTAHRNAWTLSIQRNVGGAFPAAPTTVPLGAAFVPVSLAVLDANGDGRPDFAALGDGFGSNVIRIAFGDGAGGFTTLADVLPTVPTSGTNEIAAGDVDADGDDDLLFAGPTLDLFRNTGSGLAPAVSVGPSGFDPHLRLADLDDDGDLDVVSLTDVVDAYFNDGTGAFAAPLAAFEPHEPSRDLAVADVDGDGREDLLVAATHAVRCATASAAATFAQPPASVANGNVLLGAASGDVDGDGDRDVVRFSLSTTEFVVFTNDGAGAFVATSSFAAGAVPSAMELCDLDGDALPELVTVAYPQAALFVRSNLGGTFGPAQTIPVSAFGVKRLALGDLDGDSDVDAVLESTTNGLPVVRNAGGALAQTAVVAAYTQGSDFELGDVDGDGVLDAVAVEGGNANAFRVFRGVGDGTFVTVPVTLGPIGWPLHVTSFELGDLDGDGRDDVAFLARLDSMGPPLDLIGSLRSAALPGGLLHTAFVPFGASELRLADLDLDGTRDVAFVAGALNGITWRLGAGDGTFAEQGTAMTSGTPLSLEVANFDADPEPELAFGRFLTPSQIVLQPVACRGAAAAYGHACAGSGGFAPRMAVAGCVRAGETVQWTIERARGGAIAIVLLGSGPLPIPFGTDCALQMSTLSPGAWLVPLSGVGPGQGALDVSLVLPPMLAPGLEFTMQAACTDPALAAGFTMTNGVAFVVD